MKPYNRKHSLLCSTILLLALSACKPSPPANVLSEPKIESIMTDLYIYEGLADAEEISSDTARNYAYNAILQKHGITQAQYDSSMLWYAKELKNFSKMNTRVLNHLQTMQDELKKAKQSETK